MRTCSGHRRAARAGLVALLALWPCASGALTIDDFSTDQTVSAFDPTSSAAGQVDGGMLGGERDVEVTRLQGSGVSAGAASGQLGYDNVVSGEGFARFVWDGNDDSAGLDATGLGGVDLTDLGASNAFWLDVLMSDLGAALSFVVYTDAVNFSSASLFVAGNIPPDPGYGILLHFTDFAVAGGAGADFANVGAIELTIDGGRNTPLSLALDDFSTVLAPEPSSLALLLGGLLAMCGLRSRPRD